MIIDVIVQKQAGHPENYEAFSGGERLAVGKAVIGKAARALEAQGMGDCRMAVFSPAGAVMFPARVVADWARTTVLENSKHGPRLVKFVPFTSAADLWAAE